MFFCFVFPPANPRSPVCQVIPADGGWILESFGEQRYMSHELPEDPDVKLTSSFIVCDDLKKQLAVSRS